MKLNWIGFDGTKEKITYYLFMLINLIILNSVEVKKTKINITSIMELTLGRIIKKGYFSLGLF